MAIRTKTEIMETLRGYLGEDLSDEAIVMIEDINDTMAEFERQIADVTDWQAKYDELDASWRKRYTERFFEGGSDPEGSFIEDVNDVEEQEEEAPTTYEELFEEIKEGE